MKKEQIVFEDKTVTYEIVFRLIKYNNELFWLPIKRETALEENDVLVMTKEEILDQIKGLQLIYNQFSNDELWEIKSALFFDNYDSSRAGWIYVLSDSMGNYKIGRTRALHPKQRLGDLLSVPNIKLLHYFYCTDCYERERMFHEIFAYCRIKGEWFRLSEADLNSLLNSESEIVPKFIKEGVSK